MNKNFKAISKPLYRLLTKNINSCLAEGTIPSDFKKAVVHPTHKKERKTEKSNYRQISILLNLSKIYERLLYDQMYTYFDKCFVKHQCGFRKGYDAQHSLLVMIEKMKEARDKNKVCAAVLTDLTKAFDCLKHDLFIAKLHTFGFDYKSLRVMYTYLNNRVQVTKVEHCRSDFSNYADGNTPYNLGNTSLVWMFHAKELNDRINSLREKALRLTYQNRNSSFDKLLKLDKSVSIHYRNLQYLLTEIYKVKMGLYPPIMNDLLTLDQNAFYNLRSGITVTRRNIRTNKFGFETICTTGAVL